QIEREAFAPLQRLPTDLPCHPVEARPCALRKSETVLDRITVQEGSKGEANVVRDDGPERGLIFKEAVPPGSAEALDGSILDLLFALLPDIGTLGEAENVLGVEFLLRSRLSLVCTGRAEPQERRRHEGSRHLEC